MLSAKWFGRLDACIAAIGWWMLGWGFAYGAVPQYGFIGQEQCAEAMREGVGEKSCRVHCQLEAGPDGRMELDGSPAIQAQCEAFSQTLSS